MEVQRGRYTADIDGDFVVFLIGMRLNHPLRIRKWWPVAAAMPRMLNVLSQHPELGCLGFQQWFGRTTLLVQYWRDHGMLFLSCNSEIGFMLEKATETVAAMKA